MYSVSIPGIVRDTLAFRRTNNQTRVDFVQLLLTLQQKGSVEFEGEGTDDDYLKTSLNKEEMKNMESYGKLCSILSVLVVTQKHGQYTVLAYFDPKNLSQNPCCFCSRVSCVASLIPDKAWFLEKKCTYYYLLSELTDEALVGHAFIFLVAGFEGMRSGLQTIDNFL